MTSISLLASKPTTIDAATIRDMDAKRRVDAGLVLQLVPGLLLAGATGAAIAQVGDVAARIMTIGNDDDQTGLIAQLLNSYGGVSMMAEALQRKSGAIVDAADKDAIDLFDHASLLRMAMQIRAIATSLHTWAILIDDECSDAIEVVDAIGLSDRALSLIDRAVVGLPLAA